MKPARLAWLGVLVLAWAIHPPLVRYWVGTSLANAGIVLDRLELAHLSGPVWHVREVSFHAEDGNVAVTAKGLVLPLAFPLSNDPVRARSLRVDLMSTASSAAMDVGGVLGVVGIVAARMPTAGSVERIEVCATMVCYVGRLDWRRLAAASEVVYRGPRHTLRGSWSDAGFSLHLDDGAGVLDLEGDVTGTGLAIEGVVTATRASSFVTEMNARAGLLDGLLSGRIDFDLEAVSGGYSLWVPLGRYRDWAELATASKAAGQIVWRGAFAHARDDLELRTSGLYSASIRARPGRVDAEVAGGVAVAVASALASANVGAPGAVDCVVVGAEIDCAADALEVELGRPDAGLSAVVTASDVRVENVLSHARVVTANLGFTAAGEPFGKAAGTGSAALVGESFSITLDRLTAMGVDLHGVRVEFDLAQGSGGFAAGYKGGLDAFSPWLPGDLGGAAMARVEGVLRAGDGAAGPGITDVGADVVLTDLVGRVGDLAFVGGRFDVELAGTWPHLATVLPAVLEVEHIDAGLQLAAGRAAFDLEIDAAGRRAVLLGRALEAAVLGGTIASSSYRVTVPELSGEIDVHVDELDLDQILSLEDESFHAEGKISGELPVILTSGEPLVRDGRVWAMPPGGVIRYAPDVGVVAFADENEQMKMVLSAMSNFQYRELSAALNYREDGILLMDILIEGFNPDFADGRAIEFNLNLEDDVAGLLESLRLTSELTERIESGVR